jgi:integrase/recombinase XerD
MKSESLDFIRDLLGHVSVQTTDVYARADSRQKREAFEKAYVDIIPGIAKTKSWENDDNLLDWLKKLATQP